MGAAEQLKALEAAIWDEIEDGAEGEGAGSAVVQVLTALRSSLDEVGGTARGLTESQRAMAEGMAGVLGEVVAMMRQSQSELVEAAKITDGGQVAAALTKLEKCVEEDGAKTRKTLSGVTLAMADVSRRIDALADRMAAPKRIVFDTNGRPVGMETVERGAN